MTIKLLGPAPSGTTDGVTKAYVDAMPQRFTNSATHAASVTISLTHNLGHRDYCVSVCIDSTGEDVTGGVNITKNVNSVDVVFSASQTLNTIRVTVIG